MHFLFKEKFKKKRKKNTYPDSRGSSTHHTHGCPGPAPPGQTEETRGGDLVKNNQLIKEGQFFFLFKKGLRAGNISCLISSFYRLRYSIPRTSTCMYIHLVPASHFPHLLVLVINVFLSIIAFLGLEQRTWRLSHIHAPPLSGGEAQIWLEPNNTHTNRRIVQRMYRDIIR